jgi:hypothetical protein
MRLFVLAALLGCASIASADSVTINWQTPETREDGSPLAEAEIASFAIHRGPSCSGALSLQVGNINKALRTYTFPSVEPGTYCYRVVTIDTGGRRSTTGEEQEHTVPPPAAPPSAAVISSITNGAS